MKIEKSTLDFLKLLKQNNNRDWFNEHKSEFKEVQTQAKKFYHAIMDNLNKEDEIETFKLFRIYRDVRFSKDKTPYQPHFAGSFSRSGKELRGGYYLRIRPGESFLAGGFWAPNKEDLFRIRKEFEYDATEIRKIISSKEFVEAYGGNLEGEELKSAPRGFSKEDPNLDLLKKKGYVAVRKFTDKEVLSPDFLKVVEASFLTLRPFFNYMSEVLTTNLNGESIIN